MIRSHFDLQTWLVGRDPIPVIGLSDPVVDVVGFDPADAYVETYWLPILGPSATWALRRLTGWLAGSPDGFRLPHDPFARELGLGGRTSRNGPALRALGRLVLFDMAVVTPGDELAVRTRIPPLSRRHVCRLPGHLVERHQADHAGGVTLERHASSMAPVQAAGA